MGAAQALGGFGKDAVDYALDIVDHFIVPEAQDAPTFGLDHRGPQRVLLRHLRMMSTVDLDREPGLPAREIEDIPPDNQLPGEARAVE